MTNATILHLDDDDLVLLKIHEALTENPFGLVIEYIGIKKEQELFAILSQKKPVDCILLDLLLGEDQAKGNEILSKVRKYPYNGPIIMLSNVAEVDEITEAVKFGATDYITKQLDHVELAHRIIHPLKVYKNRQISLLNREHVESSVAGATMRAIKCKIPKIIASGINSILITGESGTGKEIIANLIREHLRSDQKFIPVNCAAIAQELIESELFGHEKGAFTGAHQKKEGLIAKADGGWIFLDELACLPFQAQSALLRTLENGEVRPIGSTTSYKVNIKIVAATNEDLDLLVEKEKFREDLLQRIKSYEIYMPPLRERSNTEKSEILDHLLKRLNLRQKEDLCQNENFSPFVLSFEAKSFLMSYDWRKGNVREMWNTLQAMAVDSEGPNLTIASLPHSLRKSLQTLPTNKINDIEDIFSSDLNVPVSLPLIEQKLLISYLLSIERKYGNGIPFSRVASLLGISRWSLKGKLERSYQKGELPLQLYYLLKDTSHKAN